MANKVIKSNATISLDDYKVVKWVGKTKAGRAVKIILDDAICLDNIDWTLADKGEVIPSCTFTATYTEENRNSGEEPWHVEYADEGDTGASTILLGFGAFYIGDTQVGLTRGGGKFTVERAYRDIEADGDRGTVKGRTTIDKSVAKLQINVMQVITNMTSLYPGLTISDALSASPESTTFDLNDSGANYGNKATTVTGGIVTSVKIGDTAVTSSNYTVSDGVVTFLATYLDTLSEGTTTFTLVTSNGNVTYAVTIEDTTA